MEFMIGAIGAILVLGLFAGGVLLGWKVRERIYSHEQRVTAKNLTLDEQKKLEEAQEAWRAMYNYNPETAYKIKGRPLDKEG